MVHRRPYQIKLQMAFYEPLIQRIYYYYFSLLVFFFQISSVLSHQTEFAKWENDEITESSIGVIENYTPRNLTTKEIFFSGKPFENTGETKKFIISPTQLRDSETWKSAIAYTISRICIANIAVEADFNKMSRIMFGLRCKQPRGTIG